MSKPKSSKGIFTIHKFYAINVHPPPFSRLSKNMQGNNAFNSTLTNDNDSRNKSMHLIISLSHTYIHVYPFQVVKAKVGKNLFEPTLKLQTEFVVFVKMKLYSYIDRYITII